MPVRLSPRSAGGLALAVLVALMVAPTSPAPGRVAAAANGPTLRLTPAAGPPGTVITLHGFAPGLTAQDLQGGSGVTICIDGCADGFTDQGLVVRYDGSGRFTARLALPTVPVLTARGPLVLSDGRYPIGFPCIGPDQMGCLGSSMASAAFRVVGATGAQASACSRAVACAALSFLPVDARPGELVRVTGFAPVSPVIGRPFGYNLVLEQAGRFGQVGAVTQGMNGRLTATFRVPAVVSGTGAVVAGTTRAALEYQFHDVPLARAPLPTGVTITRKGKAGTQFAYELVRLAPTPFRIVAPPRWSALGSLTPLASAWSQPVPLAVRPGHPGDVATGERQLVGRPEHPCLRRHGPAVGGRRPAVRPAVGEGRVLDRRRRGPPAGNGRAAMSTHATGPAACDGAPHRQVASGRS